MIASSAADLGSMLREARRAKKMSQSELAAMVGVTRQWVISARSGPCSETAKGDRDELGLWLGGVYAVRLHRRAADVDFSYDRSCRTARTPALSVSMPKSQPSYGGNIAGRWIDNLLPDNDEVVQRWSGHFGEARADAFNLLRHMGADCAGAVLFVGGGLLVAGLAIAAMAHPRTFQLGARTYAGVHHRRRRMVRVVRVHRKQVVTRCHRR